MLLEPPLIDMLTMWKINGPELSVEELSDAAAIVEQASAGRLHRWFDSVRPGRFAGMRRRQRHHPDDLLEHDSLCSFHLADGALDGFLGGG